MRALPIGLAATLLIAGLAGAQENQRSLQVYFGDRPATKEDHQIAIFGPESVPSPRYAFLVDRLLPVTSAPIEDAVVLTENSKIIGFGRRDEMEIPEGYQIVDRRDSWCIPGFVELHCHVASKSFDINDTVHPTNGEMRTWDLVTLDHENFRNALAGGVTSVLYIPGSGSNMGGFGTMTKTAGTTPEEALMRFPGCLKIAQAGNPERRGGDLGLTRMGMNSGLRMTLRDAQRYEKAWDAWEAGTGTKPEFQPGLEYLRGLFRHEYPVAVHTQIYQVVLQTLRELRTEFDLWTVIVHGTFDGFRLSEEALKRGVPICNGPRQYHFDRATSKFIGLAAAWTQGGQHGWRSPVLGVGIDGIGINTDSPVVAQEQLQLQASMAVRLGLEDAVALRGLTLNPAHFIGMDDRVGSIEVGKDADLAFWNGDPFDLRSHVVSTVVNGRIVYERSEERPRF